MSGRSGLLGGWGSRVVVVVSLVGLFGVVRVVRVALLVRAFKTV